MVNHLFSKGQFDAAVAEPLRMLPVNQQPQAYIYVKYPLGHLCMSS